MFWKKIRKWLIFIPVLVLVIGLCIFKRSNQELILFLGDNSNVSKHLTELNYQTNDAFTFSKMKSKELLYYVSSNASAKYQNKKVVMNDLIKQSKVIVISIGLNDVLAKLTINKYEKKLSYDDDSLNLTFSILEQNLFNIIEHIKLLNEYARIILTSYDDPFYFLSKNDYDHNIIEVLNSLVNSISLFFNEEYLDVSLENIEYYDNEFSIYQNELGKQKTAEIIYQKIIAITS